MTDKKAKPGSTAELAELYPAPIEVPVKVRSAPDAAFEDASVTVEEMDIVQVGQAAAALAGIPNLTAANLLLIATEHQDEVMTALGIALRWPASKVALLSASSFLRLLEAVYAMNDGFFTRLLGLVAFGTMPVPKTAGAGAAPLPTSAATAESSAQRH